MPTVTLTNTARADRGVHTTDGLVMLAPGETRELALPEGEADDLPEYFAVGDRVDDKPTDELDDMDDETLRATVQAITGQEPPADADRATLLGLARSA